MSDLLINEPPLQVLPSLACAVGLNEALILQQFHYWLQHSNNIKDGHKWIYNSYQEWHKQFPFWKSKNTLISAIKHLEDMGILVSGNYNKAKFDKTKWYRIDYEKLQLLEKSQPFTKNWYTGNQDLVNAETKNWETNTNRLPENTTENTTKDILSSSHSTAAHEIVDYLNSKIGTHYRATTRKTQSLIKARMNGGFTVGDFKKVIDNKSAEWGKDSKMSKYLRPQTLFGTNFESYLNQTAVKAKKSKRINTLPF